MKKTIFLLGFFFSTLFFAQETLSQDTIKTISNVPNYKELVKKKINLKDAVMVAEKEPEFPGGFNVFKQKFFEAMPTINLKQNQKLDTYIYFIVEKDGYVRNVAAVGSNKKHSEAAETGIKRIPTRWKPAMNGDKPVRYMYMIPLVAKKY